MRILFNKKMSYIAQRKYDNIINEHIEHFAKLTKTIRRELMFLIILINNYVDEVRKTHINLQ